MDFVDFLQHNHKGMSLNKLSAMTGISRQQLSNIVCGKSIPTITTADKICKALGVTLVIGQFEKDRCLL